MKRAKLSHNIRIIHRYLGFFLAGVMAIYAISGITLIFRDSDIFKKTYHYQKVVEKDLDVTHLGNALGIRRLKVERVENGTYYFKEGTYNSFTGEAVYSIKKVPVVLNKFQSLHKAKSADPLYFMNITFGLALLFFVISSFWMFLPGSSAFKKGLYFSLAGAVFVLIMLIV